MICSSGIAVIRTVQFPFLLGMVDEAHVVWTMYCVKSGFSNISVDGFRDVLKRMCQTDPVSSKFQMGKAKLQYVINHCLFPHFKHDFGYNLEVTIYASLIRRVSERKHT